MSELHTIDCDMDDDCGRCAPQPLVALGDGVDGLSSLTPGSVGLVLSDLPSGETQAQFDQRPNLDALWPAVWRALRVDGAAVLMASRIQFAAAVIASQPEYFRYDLIWHKSVASGFLNARRRPLRAHEFVLVFSRSQHTYNPQMRTGLSPVHPHGANGRAGVTSGENYGRTGYETAGASRGGATDRYPWSVLQVPSVGQRDPRRRHPQQKPVDLLRWCVRTYSTPGELVVDPYAGSGVTGEAAVAEGRAFRGWDTDPRFGLRRE